MQRSQFIIKVLFSIETSHSNFETKRGILKQKLKNLIKTGFMLQICNEMLPKMKVCFKKVKHCVFSLPARENKEVILHRTIMLTGNAY